MPYIDSDINQDGIVDAIDLSLLVSNWNSNDPNADINNDGIVDSLDLSILVSNWGSTSSQLISTTMQSFITQRDITVTFDQEYPVGQYITGDYFVVGSPTIISKTPTYTSNGYNGSHLNPVAGRVGGIGYGAHSHPNITHNATANITENLPTALQPGDRCIFAESWGLYSESGGSGSVKAAIILTVVSAAPSVGSFRPPVTGTSETPTHNISDLNLSALPKLTPPSGVPDISTWDTRFRGPLLDWWGAGWTDRRLFPSDNWFEGSDGYYRERGLPLGDGMLMLCMNFSDVAKTPLAVDIAQYGIDLYQGLQDRPWMWGGAGGSGPGGNTTLDFSMRHMPLVFAGLLLGDSNLQEAPHTYTFHEQRCFFYVSQLTVDQGTGYTTEMIGTPEWVDGWVSETDHTRANATWGLSYRYTGGFFVGQALALRLANTMSSANLPAIFDYIDRWVGVEGSSSSHITSTSRLMWDTYRNTSWEEAWASSDETTIRNWYRANTGIAGAGLIDDDLTPSGSIFTSADGQVIEGMLVSGIISVQHDNVTIRNCKIINSGANYPIDVGYVYRDVVNTLTVEYVTCLGTDDGLPSYAGGGIMAAYIGNSQTIPTTGMGLRASHVYISGFGGGYRLSHRCDDRVEYSMVENIKIHTGSHNTGTSFRGGTGKRHYRNWIEGSTSSAISLYPDIHPILDWLMDECLLDGGTYSIHGGDNKTYGGQTTGGWTNCLFTRDHQYGPLATFNRSLPGRLWSNNKYLDGEIID